MSSFGSAGLARVPLFEGLDAAALDAILAAATRRRIAAGTAVFEQGEEPCWLPLVAEGRLKVGRSAPGGQSLTVGFLGPGEIAGCVAVFRRIPYPATATAVTDSTILAWTAPQIHALIERHPRMAANALRIVGGRAEAMLRRIEELSTERVEQRIARALLRLARDAGRPVAAGVQVYFALSRQDLAELCGATLYTVSRTLSAWAKGGIVEAGRQRVMVRDLARLAALAGERAPPPHVGFQRSSE